MQGVANEMLIKGSRVESGYLLRGRLHVYKSVYELPYDSLHDLLRKGLGF
jgi:hypothetical protein